tara:strand:- start:4288 stop:5271 length:984 start_codon:yes stop_codon:yes gene_type:complete
MRVIKDMSAEVPDTNGFYFRLEDLSDESSKDNLYNGYNALHSNFTEGDRQALLNIWMPTEFAQVIDHLGKSAVTYNETVKEVYGVCPFTTEWLKAIDSSTEYYYVFYPLNKKDIPPIKEKIYDVCYFGGIHSDVHLNTLLIMKGYNYRWMTMTHSINHQTVRALQMGLATDLDLTHNEKIERVGECKVSICYNIVPADVNHIKAIKGYPDWEKNKAFADIDRYSYFPQFKSRMHEAAIARTVNLVYRDPWKVAEDYYDPEADFVYFSDQEDLKIKLSHILNNWDSYQDMIESAYNKALNYTTENLFSLIKDRKSWKPRLVDRADLTS